MIRAVASIRGSERLFSTVRNGNREGKGAGAFSSEVRVMVSGSGKPGKTVGTSCPIVRKLTETAELEEKEL